jgi:hypothetical protein
MNEFGDIKVCKLALVVIDQNRSDAHSRETTINPYQAPLFAALNRKEKPSKASSTLF